MTRIALIQGHPDHSRPHFCHALARRYQDGAQRAGHEVRVLDVAALAFPLLRSAEEFFHGAPAPDVALARETLVWAQHLLLVYPLWYGLPPARLHGFLEQIFCPGGADGFAKGRLQGRTARLVVTMAMPRWVYRFLYGALSARALKRHLLDFNGIRTVGMTFIGLAGAGLDGEDFGPAMAPQQREGWLTKLQILGTKAR